MDLKRETLFWIKVEKQDGDGCWEWTGAKGRGYGLFHDGIRLVPAHRWLWEQTNGPIPKGKILCHHCDNRPCVRPDHLFMGTNKDNSEDMVRKGRQATGERNGKYTHPEKRQFGDDNPMRRHPEAVSRGVKNGMALLDEDKVREMRRIYDAEHPKMADLGARFGVSYRVASHAVHRNTWKHVQ